MRTAGFCVGCRRVVTVTVNQQSLALLVSGARGALSGTCDDCQEDERWRGRTAVLRHQHSGEEVTVRLQAATLGQFEGQPLHDRKAGRRTTYMRPLWRAVR